MTMPNKPEPSWEEVLDEILEQVAWYGSYRRSGDEPEGPILSPVEAKQVLTDAVEKLIEKARPNDKDIDMVMYESKTIGRGARNVLDTYQANLINLIRRDVK